MDATVKPFSWDEIEWRKAGSGRRVNLEVRADGAVIETPWLPDIRIGALRNRGFRKGLRDVVVWASGKTNYYISKLLNTFWNAASFSFPATLFMALWTTTLTAASTGSSGTEASYTSYARVSVTANTTNFPTSTAGAAITNATAITFPANTGSVQTMTFFAVTDASTAGNMLYFGSITSTAINTGDVPQVNPSGLTSSEA